MSAAIDTESTPLYSIRSCSDPRWTISCSCITPKPGMVCLAGLITWGWSMQAQMRSSSRNR